MYVTNRVPRIMQILIIDENNNTETLYNNSKYESMTTILEFKKMKLFWMVQYQELIC